MPGTPRSSESEWLIAVLARELDPRGRMPLYEQLIASLTRLIRQGDLVPGSLLPREPDLAASLGLSRQTVNQALTRLARRGLLVRRRGIGTFVAEPPIEQPLHSLYSFLRTLSAHGERAGSQILSIKTAVDAAASLFLTGKPDQPVCSISRLRFVNDEPVILEELFLPAGCGARLSAQDLTAATLYDLLQDRCGVRVTHAEETLRPVAVTRAEAALLGMAAGDAALLVERRAFAGDRPVELRRSLLRGDRFVYTVRLAAPDLDTEGSSPAAGA